MARSTVFQYKGKDIDPRKVGHDLSVQAVLTGMLIQQGDNLTIRTDLVKVSDGTELWGEQYNRKLADALAIREDISKEISERLRLRLSGEQQKQMAKRETTNAEAYQFYLKGRYYWNKRTADGLKKGIEQFQQAIDRDPNYALGYVGLADCYSLLEQYAGVPASETLPKARAAADRALQIDNSLAEAHTSSAETSMMLWHWAEAEEEFRRAINLNPNYPTAHQWFALYFLAKQQFDDALRESKRAQELDPLSPVISDVVALVYLTKNELNSAIEQFQRVIELDPSFPPAHAYLGLAYLKQRRYEEATAELQKSVELSGRASEYLGLLGSCYAVTGRRAEALVILKELEERYVKHESNGLNLAVLYTGLGDKDQAFAWLEKDFQQHGGQLFTIALLPELEDLRGDPRYADLVRRMGLQP
jgi:tetratricopeptide (TPR) repeat protein